MQKEKKRKRQKTTKKKINKLKFVHRTFHCFGVSFITVISFTYS
jgi:hypothetical protein